MENNMALKTKRTKKRKPGPKPIGQGVQVQVRLRRHELEKVDAFAETQVDEPSRAEALRRMAGFEAAPVKRGGRRAYMASGERKK
jgi:hypothetical protein